ncbi:hypothetical protein RND71_016994 [Anisodus tanguticus]|uniref:Uncharacterized protein n=1 Tax=Anisodus tanguticus TaxID=243964 RepID=A0AAE1S1G2_9SOLA|nr:hypothetical protein RND71_016994 [Anisodus tanguticus]
MPGDACSILVPCISRSSSSHGVCLVRYIFIYDLWAITLRELFKAHLKSSGRGFPYYKKSNKNTGFELEDVVKFTTCITVSSLMPTYHNFTISNELVVDRRQVKRWHDQIQRLLELREKRKQTRVQDERGLEVAQVRADLLRSQTRMKNLKE